VDPEAVRERAEVRRQPDLTRPDGTETEGWVAVDSETGCRGVGDVEREARTNLLYAVEAYHERPETSVPFASAGEDQTVAMAWLDEEGTGLVDRIRSILPF